ncbi:MAG: hypothetical protein ACO37V_06765 [Ilumatobacteraceae bacterium]
MTDEQLIEELERSHKFRTYGGDGYTLHGEAAQRLRELKLYIEQLKETKHWLNEQLLEVRTDLQLAEARNRERS